MTRKIIRQETFRALFARSGNRCAFPGCTATLINEKNQFVGQICHIEAAEPGGERYNDQQTDEQRRQYENLILLCYPHHIETNDVTEYQATRLFQMKAAHESSHGQKIFKIDESLLFKIASEMEAYWKSIDEAHRMRHAVTDLAIPIDADSSYIQLAEASYALLDRLREFREMLCQSDEKLVDWVRDFLQKVTSGELTDDEYDRRLHAFSGNNWEVLNLGVTNVLRELEIRLTQMEIRYIEEYLKTNPNDMAARNRIDQLKEKFEIWATNAIYVD